MTSTSKKDIRSIKVEEAGGQSQTEDQNGKKASPLVKESGSQGESKAGHSQSQNEKKGQHQKQGQKATQYLAVPDKEKASKKDAEHANDGPELSHDEDNDDEDATQNRGDHSDRESVYSKNSKALSKGGGDDDDGEESGEDSVDDKPSLQVRGIAKYRERREITLAQRQAANARDQANQQQQKEKSRVK